MHERILWRHRRLGVMHWVTAPNDLYGIDTRLRILAIVVSGLAAGCGTGEQPASRATSDEPGSPAAVAGESADTVDAGAIPSPNGSGDLPVPARQTDALVSNLREAFRLENARLADVNVLERRSVAGTGTGSLVLARAILADLSGPHDFTDEMFGVFRTAPDDVTVTEVIEYIPTPRWLDYTFEFAAIARDSIVLLGEDGYGLQDTHVIRWAGGEVDEYARPEDPWPGATVAFIDTLAANLYDRPEGNPVPVDLGSFGYLDYGMRVLEVRDEWFRVVIWVPSMPGCGNTLRDPVMTDTLWTRVEAADGRRLVERSAIGPC